MRLTHEAFHAWIEHMNKLLDENEVNISQIIAEWNIMVIVHEEHAKHEDDVIFKEAKRLIEKSWDTTHYSKWCILIPWIIRNQPKHNQRILFLKTLLWSMPYRCQMIGLILYRGCNDILWSDIAQEIPEIIPRGINGWRRQY